MRWQNMAIRLCLHPTSGHFGLTAGNRIQTKEIYCAVCKPDLPMPVADLGHCSVRCTETHFERRKNVTMHVDV